MRLSKYIAILILFLSIPAFGMDSAPILLANLDIPHNYYARGSYYKDASTISDPCAAMGASGTYFLWANGEYFGDASYACENSGTPIDAAEEDAGVVVESSSLDGSYLYTIDADDENVTWDYGTATIDDAGTIEISVHVPSGVNANSQICELGYDSNNVIFLIYYHTNATIIGYYKGNSSTVNVQGTASTVSGDTDLTFCYTWDKAADDHCVRVDSGTNSGCTGSGSWVCDENDSLTAFTNSVNQESVGERLANPTSITQTWLMDNYKIREGYEGTVF